MPSYIPLLGGLTGSEKFPRAVVFGLQIDDSDHLSTNPPEQLFTPSCFVVHGGLKVNGEAINVGLPVQSKNCAKAMMASSNVDSRASATVDYGDSNVNIEQMPTKNFSAITSAFATETVGDPELTILCREANDLVESTEHNRIETSEKKAKVPEVIKISQEEPVEANELKLRDSKSAQRPVSASLSDADEIEIDLDEEIDTTAYSEQLYLSMATGGKLFERPLIEEVIPEECEPEEDDLSNRAENVDKQNNTAKYLGSDNIQILTVDKVDGDPPTNELEAKTLEKNEENSYRMTTVQVLTVENVESIDNQLQPQKTASADSSRSRETLSTLNAESLNDNANTPDDGSHGTPLDRFEDSPLYQPSVTEVEAVRPSGMTAREAFFHDLDMRITEAPSLSSDSGMTIQPVVKPAPPTNEMTAQSNVVIPSTSNTTLKKQQPDYIEINYPLNVVTKCEELVAQRVTVTALLSGIAEAAAAEPLDTVERQADRITQNQADRVVPIHIGYQNHQLTIPEQVAEPETIPDTVYTCSVTTHPVVIETEKELVENLNNLLNEYQSQPTSPQFARRAAPAEQSTESEREGRLSPRSSPVDFDRNDADTVKQPRIKQTKISAENVHEVLIESADRFGDQPTEPQRQWIVWENPDATLSDYGEKLLTNESTIFSKSKANAERTATVTEEQTHTKIVVEPKERDAVWRLEKETSPNQQQIMLEQQRQQLKERYQSELLQQQQLRQQQRHQQQQQQQQQQQKDLLSAPERRPDFSDVLTVSTTTAPSRNAKSPTPTFGSLHRQNLLQNQYGHFPSSLSPRTLSRINHLNVIIETKSEKDGAEVIHNHPVFVKDTSKYWYKPSISREEAINMLKQKPPGTFVVRDSNSFPGAFGLALKVARPPPNAATQNGGDASSELVRHFLIEPSPKGVKLKGCANEPVFGTLAALVYQHSIMPLALPCRLLLPEYDPALSANEQQQRLDSNQALLERGAACNVTYLCSIDTESLTGPEALRRAAAWGLEDLARGALRAIPVHFKVSAQGITLTDNTRSQFFRRHYAAHLVTYAGIDPENRVFDNNNCCQLPPCYVLQAPIFGFVARKFVGGCMENACHVFAELDPDQPASAVVRFITNVMMPQAKNQQKPAHLNGQR